MKEIKRSSYISAYPLKVMEQAMASAGEPSGRQEEALNEMLANRAKSVSRIRISPMADPYKAPVNDPFSRNNMPL